ncbi:MAG TPA: site-specific integrase, partial [Candidatus Eisenbacteria bacterium]
LSLGSDYARALDAFEKIRGGKPVAADAITLDAAFDVWIEKVMPTRRTEQGVQDIRSRFRRLTSRFLGHIVVDRIRPDDLRELRLWVERKKSQTTQSRYSAQTVRHALREVSMLLDWCVEAGYIDRSPVPKRLMPKVGQHVPKPFSPDEVRKLLKLKEPYRWVIRLALATGCRWSELCAVEAKDLQNGALVVRQPKTGTVKRIPIEPKLAREIQKRSGRLVAFSSTSKGSFNAQVTRRSGVRFNVHRLRHTAATTWLSNGVPIEVVSRLLGHRNISTTEIYAGLLDRAVRRELEAFWARPGTLPGTIGSERTSGNRAKLQVQASLGR